MSEIKEKNKLGKASVVLGIISIIFTVFLPWIFLGAGSATGFFVSLITGALGVVVGYGTAIIGFILGLVGVFRKGKKKTGAIVGMILCLLAIILPAVVLNGIA